MVAGGADGGDPGRLVLAVVRHRSRWVGQMKLRVAGLSMLMGQAVEIQRLGPPATDSEGRIGLRITCGRWETFATVDPRRALEITLREGADSLCHGIEVDESPAHAYTLAEVRDGTGFAKGVRFLMVKP